MNTKVQHTVIHITPDSIEVSYNVFKKSKTNGKIICYIPAFDYIFSANNDNEIKVKSEAMIASFFDYYEKEESFKSMIIQIHKMGFRSAQHNYIMSQLLNKKPLNKADMKIVNSVPEEFEDAESIFHSSKYKMAS